MIASAQLPPDEIRQVNCSRDASRETCDSDDWLKLLALLSKLESRVARANPDQPIDQLLETRERVLFLQERLARMRGHIDLTFVATIEKHGPIQIGESQLFLATMRKILCRDKTQAFDRVLEATFGDLDRACEQLVAQPFKNASIRSLLGEIDFAKCFETRIENGLEETPKRLAKESVFR